MTVVEVGKKGARQVVVLYCMMTEMEVVGGYSHLGHDSLTRSYLSTEKTEADSIHFCRHLVVEKKKQMTVLQSEMRVCLIPVATRTHDCGEYNENYLFKNQEKRLTS